MRQNRYQLIARMFVCDTITTITVLKQTKLKRGRQVNNPIVSWLLTGPLSILITLYVLQFATVKSSAIITRSNITWYCTVYPKKYAHGFCFAVLCCGYTLTDFPISIRLTSLALWQSNDCPSASKATLMNMDKYFMWIHYERWHNHNKAKHNKTVCIFLGIYCTHHYSYWIELHTKCNFQPTKDTPYLAKQASYGVSFVMILEKIDQL